MIKYFCDRCGNKMKHGHKLSLYGTDIVHLCNDCYKLLESVKDKINMYNTSDVKNFCNMSDVDIELLHHTFKVGDKVITDDGRIGTIRSICDCDRCKQRRFYEPKVEMKIGVNQIWITDTDKENGFRSFYQIGDRVFGNVDKEASKYILERIAELEHELTEYEEQLEVVRELKENNNGN